MEVVLPIRLETLLNKRIDEGCIGVKLSDHILDWISDRFSESDMESDWMLNLRLEIFDWKKQFQKASVSE